MTSLRCSGCGARLDRPALYGCKDAAHPAPDLAQRIARAIEMDLFDRKHMGLDRLDPDIADQIRDKWASIVRGMLP